MEQTTCAMIAIVGRPNVGKSTLLNALVGEKVAIISAKPQTTRNRITGVVTRDRAQYIFLDTPGLHRARTRLGEYMDNVSRSSVADVDVAVLVVEPVPSPGEPERELMRRMEQLAVPSVLVINKIDRLEQKDKLLAVIDAYQKEHSFDAVVPVSAKEGDGVEELMGVLKDYQAESPWYFPEDAFTDQPERQIMGEILREKLLTSLDKEIPHGTAVSIERFHERPDGVVEIEAIIYCEKESHKGIIIGKKGAMLKKISSQARESMEEFLDTKVYLQTWVKVKENWRDNPGLIRSFGFTED
ncbi:MAG: GTPase Era [Clostridiales bacterium]|nr:GTPase Era [Clostridiales bacterium]MCD7881604.1 GTPase Era [Clostridiales bacterium]